MVAASLAVVKCGRPAFGFGSLAINSRPSSMAIRKTLLKFPSGSFSTLTQERAPIACAETWRSPGRLNSLYVNPTVSELCLTYQSYRYNVQLRQKGYPEALRRCCEEQIRNVPPSQSKRGRCGKSCLPRQERQKRCHVWNPH